MIFFTCFSLYCFSNQVLLQTVQLCPNTGNIRIFSSDVFLLCVCSFYLLHYFRNALNVLQIPLLHEGAMPWPLLLHCSETLRRSEDALYGGHTSSFIIHSDSNTHIVFSDILCTDGIPVFLQRMASLFTVLKIALFFSCDVFGKVCKS
jgi:hypothetical protein